MLNVDFHDVAGFIGVFTTRSSYDKKKKKKRFITAHCGKMIITHEHPGICEYKAISSPDFPLVCFLKLKRVSYCGQKCLAESVGLFPLMMGNGKFHLL